MHSKLQNAKKGLSMVRSNISHPLLGDAFAASRMTPAEGSQSTLLGRTLQTGLTLKLFASWGQLLAVVKRW